ncbi:AAA family ATPase [Propionibacterium freudenreichii]|uniref:PIF1 helicase n=1 Tax=Propionibacterium freudenreichii TaxID=1744 RepID=A0A509MH39_9ACTN|nr:AAA family ATPase [Propionibacterium freudenreichii]SCQ74797.1 PIF1 helicase [Propionibacterium freudenreichii]
MTTPRVDDGHVHDDGHVGDEQHARDDGLVLTAEFRDALTRLARGENLFLTGKAGSGKSTLIRLFMESNERTVVVAAPTGIAALNVDGYTIHRLFSFNTATTTEQVASGDYYPGRFARTLKSLDTLIIDEVSMVRADLFDCLVAALERFGPHPGQPLGGVQLVLVGDLYQLPPVVTEGEREYFSTTYESPWFFSAHAYRRDDFPTVELTTVFRQIGDARLVHLLNAVRDGRLLAAARAELNQRTDPGFEPPIDEFWLTLATTNRIAAARNNRQLARLGGRQYSYRATVTGDATGFDAPADEVVTFAVGAQVMMLTNAQATHGEGSHDRPRWVNGTIGRIAAVRYDHDEPVVTIALPDGRHEEAGPHVWDITRPVVEGGRLRHEVVGSFTQLPFRLAWAITIHKSQGQTLDHAIVDLSGGTFAEGQLYVALSRCTSLAGLVLARPVLPKDLKADQRIRRFLASARTSVPRRGLAFLTVTFVGDEGRMWRPRPLELAVVTDDGRELVTLVNPDRDMGESARDNALSASDVRFAPMLGEAWPAIERCLDGYGLIGVDIDQTLDYLDYELKRGGIVSPMPIGGEAESLLSPDEARELDELPTLQRARRLRELVLARRGTGREFPEGSGPRTAAPTTDPWADIETFSRAGAADGGPVRHGDGAEQPAVLLVRDGAQRSFVVDAPDMASEADRAAFLAARLRAAASRTVVDDGALAELEQLERQWGVTVITDAMRRPADSAEQVFVPGARVCFTGSVIDARGTTISRSDMEQLAAEHELVAVPSVTRTRCDVLVAADTASRSGKARKALDLGKPVISAAEFLAWANPAGPGR